MKKTKTFTALVISMTMGLSLVSSNNSNAVLAIFYHSIVGYVVVGIQFAIGIYAINPHRDANTVRSGYSSLIWGIVDLNDDEASVKFSALDQNAATAIGATDTERASYNSQLDEINDVASTISMEVNAYAQEGHTDDEVTSYAHALWLLSSDSLSPDSLGALQKISASFAATAAN